MTSPSLPNEFFADPNTVESAVEGRGRGLGNLFFSFIHSFCSHEAYGFISLALRNQLSLKSWLAFVSRHHHIRGGGGGASEG